MASIREVTTIVAPFVPASLNRVMRWNPRRKKAEREMWENTIYILLGQKTAKQLRERAALKVRMRVCITICNPKRYDDDNAHGACKIVFDAMRNIGVLHDDRDKYCQQEVKQDKATKFTRRTIIEIGAL